MHCFRHGRTGDFVVIERLALGHDIAGMVEAIRGDVVVQVGDLPGGPVPAPPNLAMARKLDLRGSCRFHREFAEAVGLIGVGRGDVLAIVTARRPLAEAPEAFRLALDRNRSVKGLLPA
jgi:L-idonate 5-dehydrogenase